MVNVGKYTSPTDPMGMGMMCKYFIVTNILRNTNTIPKLKRQQNSFNMSLLFWSTKLEWFSVEQCLKTWLIGVYRGITLSSYVGIILNHYKDPY